MFRQIAMALVLSAAAVLAGPGQTAERPAVPYQVAQATAADNLIKSAQGDLDRLEKQAASLKPGSSSVKRTQKLLGLTEKRLNSSKNQSHPSWTEANQRLQALKQRLSDLAAGKAPGAAPKAAAQPSAPATAQPAKPAPTSTQSTSASASDKRMAAGLRRMRELEVSAERVTAGMPRDALAIVKGLNELPKKYVKPAEDKAHPRWGELYKRYQTLRTAMLKIAIDAEAARLSGATTQKMRDLEAMDPVAVQVPAETAKWRQLIAAAREQQAKLPDQKNAKVKAFGGNINKFQKVLEAKLAFVPKPPAKLWSGDWPEDKPVLIDTIGSLETKVLVVARVARPMVWVPEPYLLVRFSGYESDDIIIMQVMDGGKAIGKPMRCGARFYFKKLGLSQFKCRPSKDFGLTETGVFKLKVTYRQTLVQQDHPLAELTLPVLELKHGAKSNPSFTFGDDLDASLNVSTIEETGGTGFNHASSELGFVGSGRSGAYDKVFDSIITAHDLPESTPTALIRTWFKAGKNMIRTKIACLYNGKKVGEAPDTSHDDRSIWSFTEGGEMRAVWTRISYLLHMLIIRPRYSGLKIAPAGSVHYLSENPGEYRCVITGNGEILKELYFTIGKDGQIVKPECQAKSMKNLRQVTLLRQVNKKLSFVPYDKAAGQKAGYYGNAVWAKGCPLMQ